MKPLSTKSLKKIFKTIGYILLGVFLMLNFVLGYFCLSSIFLTISVYVVLYLTISLFIQKNRNRTNYKLFFGTLILSFLAVEVSLKYIFKIHLSYTERNGELFYRSMYDTRGELEFFVRKYIAKQPDSIIFFRLNTPNSQELKACNEFAYVNQYNSLGFRDKEFNTRNDTPTIICLGDSYTEGSGTPSDSTWVHLLENNLNERLANKVSCLNAGIAGSDPISEFVLMKTLLYRYHPKIILVAINSTDINDIIARGGMDRVVSPEHGFIKRPLWWEYIYQFSFISRVIIHKVFQLDEMLMTSEQRERENAYAMDEMKKCLTKFNELSLQLDSKFVVIFHPLEQELTANEFPFTTLIDELDCEKSIKTINLFEEFNHQKMRLPTFEYSDIFWPIDGHNNSKGYKLWADIVSDNIILDTPIQNTITQTQH